MARLNTRHQRQLLACSCLEAYCIRKNIRDLSVTLLISHLRNCPEQGSAVEWLQRGAELPLNGRGGPLPEDMILHLPPDEQRLFLTLVGYVVGVGLVSVHREDDDLSWHFMKKVIDALDQVEVVLH